MHHRSTTADAPDCLSTHGLPAHQPARPTPRGLCFLLHCERPCIPARHSYVTTTRHCSNSQPATAAFKAPMPRCKPKGDPCAVPKKASNPCSFTTLPTPSTAFNAAKRNQPPAPAFSMPAMCVATAHTNWPSSPPPCHEWASPRTETSSPRPPAPPTVRGFLLERKPVLGFTGLRGNVVA